MYRSGDAQPPKERGRHRLKVENDIIRRREREFNRQQMWGGAEQYFRHWDKVTSKFDSWTSPRYYEDNNRLLSDIRQKRDKQELLEKRRARLKKLLEEEKSSHEIEMMVHRSRGRQGARPKMDDVPTEILKEVNVDLKQAEEERRKREAENKLFVQWRKNNPLVRQMESKYSCRDLKLSWLDQQIEKRMQKEREEEEAKRLLSEREERSRKERQLDEQRRTELEEKRKVLREGLDEQMGELRRKQELSDELKKLEEEEFKKKLELEELRKKHTVEESRRKERECALYNVRQHKLKLKQRAFDVQENLNQELKLIERLKDLEIEDVLKDAKRREEIKFGIEEFFKIVKEQQELEKQRQKHLEFIFDSEARQIYNKQTDLWKMEEESRRNLVREVLDTIKEQIDENLDKNKNEQMEILREREKMTEKIEEYDKELADLQEMEEKKKKTNKMLLDEELKLKSTKKKQQENMRLKEIDEELDRIRNEEERLKKEIMKIQQKQRNFRPTSRSRLW